MVIWRQPFSRKTLVILFDTTVDWFHGVSPAVSLLSLLG